MAASLIRLLAEVSMRDLMVANAAQSQEGATEVQKRFVLEMSGQTEEEAAKAAELDREGLDDLKALQFNC